MDNKNSYYNKNLRKFARELRNDSTLGEIILWSKVLKSKGMGYQFNRQFPMQIDNLRIIADFICRPLKLIIEIDDYSHNDKFVEDQIRDNKLAEKGYFVLRFSEQEIKYAIDDAVTIIEQTILELEEKHKIKPI